MSKKFSYYSSYSSFLLNNFTNAYYAWSVARRLSSMYTGALIRVRRSSDNAELDIGYNSSNNLDTSALMTFAGSSSAFVTKKYDQTGNGRHFIQTTSANQPRIVNAGVLDTEGGKPCCVYTGAHIMSVSGLTPLLQPTNGIMVYVFKLTADLSIIHNGSGTGSGQGYLDVFINGSGSSPYQNSGTPTYFKNGTSITATRDNLYDQFINTQALMSIANINLVNVGWNGSIFDGYGGGYNLKGTFQEDVLFADQTNSQTGIENNIKTYYGL